MNCEVCQLKELEVEHFEIREVLRCILHTIMFHRALGLVRPRDIDLQLFEVTYVQCGDSDLEKKIDEKIDQFISWVEKHPNKKSQIVPSPKESRTPVWPQNDPNKTNLNQTSSPTSVPISPKLTLSGDTKICLSFYEVKNNKAMWFSNKVERLYWEQWYINLHVVQHPKAHSIKSHHSKVLDTGENASDEESARRIALEASLREVLFQIIRFVNEKKDHVPPIPSREGISFPYEITIPSTSDNTFDMIKRMLQTGHPTMLS